MRSILSHGNDSSGFLRIDIRNKSEQQHKLNTSYVAGNQAIVKQTAQCTGLETFMKLMIPHESELIQCCNLLLRNLHCTRFVLYVKRNMKLTLWRRK